MKLLIDVALIVALVFVGKNTLPKVNSIVEREVRIKINNGLPSLNSFTMELIKKRTR